MVITPWGCALLEYAECTLPWGVSTPISMLTQYISMAFISKTELCKQVRFSLSGSHSKVEKLIVYLFSSKLLNYSTNLSQICCILVAIKLVPRSLLIDISSIFCLLYSTKKSQLPHILNRLFEHSYFFL